MKPGCSTEPALLPVAVRAYTEPINSGREPETDENRSKRLRRLMRTRHADNHRPVLIFDTETRTDPSLALMFGAYRYCRWEGDRLVCLLEGLIVADNLPERDEQAIRDYWRSHKLDTAADQSIFDSAPTLWLSTERQFVKMLYRACFEPGPSRAAALVGLNLNFDVSRLAKRWGESRTEKYANGFTLDLHGGYVNANGERRESKFHPRYGTKHLSSTKALKGFIARFSGHIIDVRTLAFALTNRGYSLESGCEAYGVPYVKREVRYGEVYERAITYCREDVEATHRLYERLIADYDRHPIPLQASQAYSPASIGKGYLAGMGIRPRLELQPEFPRDQLGIAMSAFYGGRTECRIARVPVPIVYCDLMSAYTTANSLMDLWRIVTAERVELADATERVREFVERTDLNACLNPETWLRLPALVQIRPRGDVFPVRGRYAKDKWNIGSNPLWSDEPLWYALPDVIASKLITGRAPKIIQALAVTPSGTQPGLNPIKLRGEVKVDPSENFFRTVIEQRHELPDKKGATGQFLKTLANAASYGIYAEMIRSELPGRKTERVRVCDWTGEPYELAGERNPERPGRYLFAPMAALITAGTRLLLAISERLVADVGGTWAMMDTDSIAVVSTERGGLVRCPGGRERDSEGRECVRALSWAQADQIRERMRSLNPYRGRAGSKSILELEDENYALDPANPRRVTDARRQLYCYAISSKRYSLYNLTERGEPELRAHTLPDRQAEEEARATCSDEQPAMRKRSDHGLGYLINPVDPDSGSRDWIAQGWEWILRTALGLDAPEPAWFDRPALMRAAVTTPRLLANFATYNTGEEPREQMRPFNFYMVAQDVPTIRDEQTGETWISPIAGKCALIAPYEPDPGRWDQCEWINHYQPDTTFRVTTSRNPFQLGDGDDLIPVRTLRDIFTGYRRSVEAKSLAPDETACDGETIGLLRRRPVRAASIVAIGKEMNAIEEELIGVRQDEGERLNTYRRPGQDPFDRLVRPVIRTLPVQQVAAGAGVSERTVKRARSLPAEQSVWIAASDQRECGHHHRHLTAAVRCCRQMERHYRRTYAGRPGYAKREDWIAERTHAPALPEPISETTRAKLTGYAVKHARAELRRAGILDNLRALGVETLLASHLGRVQRAGEDVRGPGALSPAGSAVYQAVLDVFAGMPVCAGCERVIFKSFKRGPVPQYHDERCRSRARRRP